MLIGVVGKTNVGKSTLFKASTLAEVEIFNRPFVTIKPNHGCGFVRVKCAESDFDIKCQPKTGYCLQGIRFVPIDLLDVAGLVPGAHKGEGLGTQFLDDLSQADVLIHVIDISGSTNAKGENVPSGDYDPAEDIKFLEQEIDMWFYKLLRKKWEKFARTTQQTKRKIDEAIAQQFSGLKIDIHMVSDVMDKLKLPKKISEWSQTHLKDFASELRKVSKRMIIAANKADIKGSKENLEKLKKEFPGYMIVPCSAESELALREAAKKQLIEYVPGDDDFKIIDKEGLNPKQQKALEFIKSHVLDKYGSTGVQDVLNKAVFDILKHIAVFPVATTKLTDKDGNVLPDCFLVPENINPREFAYKIHTDIGDKFIKAIDMKTKLLIGKEKTLNHGDVVEIVTDR
ncbi:MAG: Ribosome-binding ATPase YchF [Candidatus Woesearchaeota archaeon]|nr:Ribosome-binding ATPase YchF [Candidatus Woesearchaeota archaeon]